jgi:hypothetical protein
MATYHRRASGFEIVGGFILLVVVSWSMRFVWDFFAPDITVRKPLENDLNLQNAACLYIPEHLSMDRFDGKIISKRKPGFTAKAASVLVPPGIHTFGFDYNTSSFFDFGGKSYSAYGLEATEYFIAGGYYKVNISIGGYSGRQTISIQINETNEGGDY